MDMRRLKSIALCFCLTAATLASQDVSAAPVKKYNRALAPSKIIKAFGGRAAYYAADFDFRTTVMECALREACWSHFNGALGPSSDIEAVRSALK